VKYIPSTRSRSQVRPTYISPTPPVSCFGAKIYQGHRAAASSTPCFGISNDSFDFDSGLGLTRVTADPSSAPRGEMGQRARHQKWSQLLRNPPSRHQPAMLHPRTSRCLAIYSIGVAVKRSPLAQASSTPVKITRLTALPLEQGRTDSPESFEEVQYGPMNTMCSGRVVYPSRSRVPTDGKCTASCVLPLFVLARCLTKRIPKPESSLCS
jgi:hypothetical protein